jgi:hypothetical protein
VGVRPSHHSTPKHLQTELKIKKNDGGTLEEKNRELTLSFDGEKSSWRWRKWSISGEREEWREGERLWPKMEENGGSWMVTLGYLYPLPILVKFFHFDPAFRFQLNFKNLLSPELDLKFNLLSINKFTRIKILVFTINALSGPIPGRKLFFSRESPGLLFGTWQLSPP